MVQVSGRGIGSHRRTQKRHSRSCGTFICGNFFSAVEAVFFALPLLTFCVLRVYFGYGFRPSCPSLWLQATSTTSLQGIKQIWSVGSKNTSPVIVRSLATTGLVVLIRVVGFLRKQTSLGSGSLSDK